MNRKLTHFAVVVLAILTAELLHAYAHHYFVGFIKGSSPYKFVALSMAVAVLVFYPVFHFLEKYLKAASEKYVEGAKSITRNRFIGLLLGFAAALLLLFAGYAQVWFHKNPIIDFKLWLKGLL